MQKLMTFTILLASCSAFAMDAKQTMQTHAWQHRVLLIFSPAVRDADYQTQDSLLAGHTSGLLQRDMFIIRAIANGQLYYGKEPRPDSADDFYRLYDVETEAFRVILVGKDGSVKLSRNSPVSTNDLFTLIDAMPMRQYEMLQDVD